MVAQKPNETYHQKLHGLIDSFVYDVYRITKFFPKEEVFGATNQLRRAALSVALNYVEGYARQGEKELLHFLKISYGSLKEARYIIALAQHEGWLDQEEHERLQKSGDAVGKMLWPIFSKK